MVSIRVLGVTACFLLVGFAGLGMPGAAQPPTRDFIVAFLDAAPDAGDYRGHSVVARNDALHVLVVRTSDAPGLARSAQGDRGVLYLEPDDEIYHTLLTPTDPLYAGYQYDLKPATTNMESAWDLTLGSTAVKVCIVDTGQYRAHQDFAGVAWGEWKDFVRGKTAAYDDNGHGTHVTGTVAAGLNNGKGIAGIAPNVTVAGAKVLSRSGSGTVSAVANGISWCADIGADVINLSLGGGYSSTIEAAVNYATAAGALVVAAAGNSGPCSDCVGYPAALPNAFAVACTTSSNAQCSFSSEGPQVDVAAPGASIASTFPAGVSPCKRTDTNCYVLMSGTSMSTPHVAALAALVKSAFPAATPQELRDRITATAVDLGTPGADPEFGAGLIRGAAVY